MAALIVSALLLSGCGTKRQGPPVVVPTLPLLVPPQFLERPEALRPLIPGFRPLEESTEESGENLVSEADILNYITYFGLRCRAMETQLNTLISLIEEHNAER
ncbi:hypothetical protein LJC23_04330 [Desulfovibrio sp. OttesenSCG-928-I05]|nr:hypothetical protein [Desulfovibrio sp. OttesenSCG-928-I05]